MKRNAESRAVFQMAAPQTTRVCVLHPDMRPTRFKMCFQSHSDHIYRDLRLSLSSLLDRCWTAIEGSFAMGKGVSDGPVEDASSPERSDGGGSMTDGAPPAQKNVSHLMMYSHSSSGLHCNSSSWVCDTCTNRVWNGGPTSGTCCASTSVVPLGSETMHQS